MSVVKIKWANPHFQLSLEVATAVGPSSHKVFALSSPQDWSMYRFAETL